MAPRMAFLGMGQMGRAMSKNLAAKSNSEWPLLLWNRNTTAAQQVASEIHPLGKVAAGVAEAVAGADIIWSCLKDDTAVQTVYDQVLGSDVHGKVCVDCSSIAIDLTNSLAERIGQAGGTFVAMPVFGDPGMAERALLICILCGPQSGVAQVKPFLKNVIAHTVIDMADQRPGNALEIKLIGNTLLLAAINSIAEALTFAEKTGIGAEHMANLIRALFPRPPHALYTERMMSGEYHSGTAAADLAMARALAAKVLQMADKAGASVTGYRVAVDRLAEAEIAHHSGADITALYGAVRLASGLPFNNGTKEK